MNILGFSGIYSSVRRFTNLFFVLAAALWLPASAHCQLKSLPGFEFLACESGNDCCEVPKSKCDGSGCCTVEGSQYKTVSSRLTRTPCQLLISQAVSVDVVQNLPAQGAVGILTTAPPELLQARHFLFRTALPVRAPSSAS